MIILAIDSCGSACGACVWHDGDALSQQIENMERGQDARLMPMIVDTIRKAGVDFPQLNKIAVTRGPGSFTGVRVGLAAARGIGLAAGKPVIGIDRFAAYRALCRDAAQDILVIINSKRAELFCRFYPASGPAHDAVLMTQNEIEGFLKIHPNTLCVGDMDKVNHNELLAACAGLAAMADPTNPDYLPRPLYLRAPDVTLPKSR